MTSLESPGRGSPSIRVVLAEDQAMVLGALAALLEMSGGISVVGRAQNGTEALARVLELKPDVFITDIEMPEMSGLDVAAEFAASKGAEQGHHCDHLRQKRLSAAGARCWGHWISTQRQAGRAARRSGAPRASWSACD